MTKRNMIFLMAQLLSVSMAFAGNDRDEESSFPFVFLLLVVLILIGVVAFFGWRILRDLRQKLEDMDAKVQKYKVQLSEELKALPKEVRNHLDTNKVQTKSQSEMQEQKDAVTATASAIVHSEHSQILYSKAPSGRVFEHAHVPCDAQNDFYMLEVQGNRGVFEFNPNFESISKVKDGFLNSACDISNHKENSSSKIVTDARGSICRVGDGWKICKKANVHFEKESAEEEQTVSKNTEDSVTSRTEEPSSQILYSDAPNENSEFCSVSTTFEKNKFFIYKLTVQEETGYFEFNPDSDADSINFIKRNLSYLESACEIENVEQDSFSKIITITPGKVKYIEGVWRIEELAKVQLVK
ncbi:MAG: hypothetical protein KAY43_04965 [Phocaeicola sp.]|jgi:hypothetical protein|nr:hypothetical protein [Phocaeicola sp.]